MPHNYITPRLFYKSTLKTIPAAKFICNKKEKKTNTQQEKRKKLQGKPKDDDNKDTRVLQAAVLQDGQGHEDIRICSSKI